MRSALESIEVLFSLLLYRLGMTNKFLRKRFQRVTKVLIKDNFWEILTLPIFHFNDCSKSIKIFKVSGNWKILCPDTF